MKTTYPAWHIFPSIFFSITELIKNVQGFSEDSEKRNLFNRYLKKEKKILVMNRLKSRLRAIYIKGYFWSLIYNKFLKSRIATFADFKTSPIFSESWKLLELWINVPNSQFYILAIWIAELCTRVTKGIDRICYNFFLTLILISIRF